MEDLGAPLAYVAVPHGVPVYGPGGEKLGTLVHVLADPGVDVFDGLIVDTTALMPGGHRFVDADDVGDIYERGIVLKVGEEGLHEPSESPGVMRADPGEGPAGPLQDKLRRAWDWVSGNR